MAFLALATMPVMAQDKPSPQSSSKGFYLTAGAGGGWAGSPTVNHSTSGTVGTGIPYTSSSSWNLNLGAGASVDAGIGYDFGNSIRGEITYVYNGYSIGDTSHSGTVSAAGMTFPQTGTLTGTGNLTTNSIMFSGYYDLKNKSKFTPYVGGGLGWTSVSHPALPATATVGGTTISGTVNHGSASALGYIAKAGVTYSLSKPVDLFAEGIYQGNTGVTLSEASLGALNTFAVRGGFRYRFAK